VTQNENFLEELWSDTLRSLKAKRPHPAQAVPHIKCCVDRQAPGYSPATWQVGRIVEIFFKDDSGNLTLLGKFQEYTHKRPIARKLVRVCTGDCEGDAEVSLVEVVSGRAWAGPYASPGTTDTEEEVQAIEAIFRDEILRN
jgi:hypothetical protein